MTRPELAPIPRDQHVWPREMSNPLDTELLKLLDRERAQQQFADGLSEFVEVETVL